MALETITVSDVIPATPEQIFEAWLDADAHGSFTGSPATIAPHAGGRFTAWDGYIAGTTVTIEQHSRIVQRWRTSEFPADAKDSLLEVFLEPVPGGTRLIITHSEIPEGQGEQYQHGWHVHYFEPMKRYFADRASDVLQRPKTTRPPQSVKKAAGVAKAAPKAKVRVKAKAAPKAKAKVGVKAKAKKRGASTRASRPAVGSKNRPAAKKKKAVAKAKKKPVAAKKKPRHPKRR